MTVQATHSALGGRVRPLPSPLVAKARPSNVASGSSAFGFCVGDTGEVMVNPAKATRLVVVAGDGVVVIAEHL